MRGGSGGGIGAGLRRGGNGGGLEILGIDKGSTGYSLSIGYPGDWSGWKDYEFNHVVWNSHGVLTGSGFLYISCHCP